MAAVSHSIAFGRSRVNYRQSGHGPDLLFCFHGYGEDAASFDFLEHPLEERFTLIAIDMPFHGRTQWAEGLSFSPPDLISIIDDIDPSRKPIHLLGYSMGGRMALSLLHHIPERIAGMVLIAPDGLHRNPWQWIATRTRIGNKLFHYTMKHPGWMMGLLNLSARLGWYDRNLLKFVHHYLDDAEQRMILYRRWTSFRNFKPDLKSIRGIVTKHNILIKILFGKYDRVIVTKHGLRFAKNAEAHIQVIEIEAGHQLLREKHTEAIAGLLK